MCGRREGGRRERRGMRAPGWHCRQFRREAGMSARWAARRGVEMLGSAHSERSGSSIAARAYYLRACAIILALHNLFSSSLHAASTPHMSPPL